MNVLSILGDKKALIQSLLEGQKEKIANKTFLVIFNENAKFVTFEANFSETEITENKGEFSAKITKMKRGGLV